MQQSKRIFNNSSSKLNIQYSENEIKLQALRGETPLRRFRKLQIKMRDSMKKDKIKYLPIDKALKSISRKELLEEIGGMGTI